MLFWEGAAAVLACVCLHAVARGLHHGAHAPAWARSQRFATLSSLLLVAIFPLAVGVFSYGLTQVPAAMGWEGIAGLILGSALISWGVPRIVGR